MSRNWCFTYFEKDGDWANPKEWKPNEDIRYVVWQTEECPKTGRRHQQGYVQFRIQCARKTAIKRLGGDAVAGIHVEAAKGNATQCRAYCTKEETRVAGPWELGDLCTGAGVRTDLMAMAAKIADGEELEVQDYLRWGNRIDLAILRTIPARDPANPVEVHILWGEAGTGKTRYVHEKEKGDLYVASLAAKGWWNGYRGEGAVLFDEFDIKKWDREYLLQVLDRYPMRVEVKNGDCQLAATRFYLTMNREPYEEFQAKLDNALRRRITSTTEMLQVG